MSYLKQLFMWFLGKEVPAAHEPSLEIAQIPVPQNEDKADKDSFQFHIIGASRKTFLEELRTIEPLSKEFDQAKDDIVQELRRLAPHRSPKYLKDRAS